MSKIENYRKQIKDLSKSIISDEELDISDILLLLDFMRVCSEAGLQPFSQKAQRQIRRILDF